jgi:hypothetical protein
MSLWTGGRSWVQLVGGVPLAWHWVLLGQWALLQQVEQVRECTRCRGLWLLADALEAVGWIRWTCWWLMLL